MALWGRNDQSVTANSSTTKESTSGAPIGVHTLVKSGGQTSVRVDSTNAHFGNTSSGSRAAVDAAMFGNTTIGAFIPGQAVGIFGVDTTEVNISGGLAEALVTTAGSGYQSNAVVTITFANGTTNTAYVNSTSSAAGATAGRITALNINVATTGITGGNPSVSVAAPAAFAIVANTTGIVAASDFIKITTANSFLQVGDRLFYGVTTGNTATSGLTGNTYYYVSFANTTGVAVAATSGGANIDLTEARATASETGHTLQGDTATGYVVLGGGASKGIAHAGWTVRREGSGGRAGRVQYEVLVAMGSLGAQTAAFGTAAAVADASDDTQLPDS